MTSLTSTKPEAAISAKRRPTLRTLIRLRPELVLIPTIFVIFVAAWELAVQVLQVPKYVLPTPSTVVSSLVQMVQTPSFWNNFSVTVQEIGLGFVCAVILAFVLGTLISQVPLLEKTLLPYLVAIQTIPKVALAPLFLIWFGFGLTSKVVMTTVIAFFPILINVIEGLRATDSDKIEMLRSVGATKYQIFRMVRLPNAAPFIYAGLDLGIIFAVIGAVVGEFVGAKAGLGYQMLQYNYDFNVASMFATLIVLSALGMTGHSIVRGLQRRFAFWALPDRTPGV